MTTSFHLGSLPWYVIIVSLFILELTQRTKYKIKGSSSNARRELKIAVRKIIPHVYGLTNDGKTKSIAKNRKRVAQLLTGHAYMYKDSVGLTGYGEAPIASLVLRAAWFKNPRDLGNKFSEYFNPISAVTLALIFTVVCHGMLFLTVPSHAIIQVQYCLEEWSTGVEKEGSSFTKAGYKQQYDARLSDIEDWSNMHPEFFKNLGKKLYKRARTKSGAIPLDQDATDRLFAAALKQAQDLLAGHTGNIDGISVRMLVKTGPMTRQ
ncbi:hypothetical protein OF83DRAFT_1178957 [Amylostereum chailletii]|nr:hypothetical protein OF83DRAFT_1178957 [Amylostereum chailletii]